MQDSERLDLIDVPPQAHMLDKNILNFQRKRKKYLSLAEVF